VGDNRTGKKWSKTTKTEELDKRRGGNGKLGKKRLAKIINFLRSKFKQRDRISKIFSLINKYFSVIFLPLPLFQKTSGSSE